MRSLLILFLAACAVPNNNTGPGGGSESDTTPCELLNLSVSSTGLVSTYPEGNTYGVNTFAIWETSTYGEIETSLPSEDWQVPELLWGAIRFNLDGYDPYHFTATDQFVYRYLPWVPSNVSWQSTTDATNDGSCPGSNTNISGWDSCIGRTQLDRASPLLQSGVEYLVRMGMILPLGDTNGYMNNRVQSCYQTIFTF